jgi:hypothetical protein
MKVKTYCHKCGTELGVIDYLYKDNLVIFVDRCKCMKQKDSHHKVIVVTTGKDNYNKIVTEFI